MAWPLGPLTAMLLLLALPVAADHPCCNRTGNGVQFIPADPGANVTLWSTSPEELRTLGLLAHATALAEPGHYIELQDRSELQRFHDELRNRSASVVGHAGATYRAGYVVGGAATPSPPVHPPEGAENARLVTSDPAEPKETPGVPAALVLALAALAVIAGRTR